MVRRTPEHEKNTTSSRLGAFLETLGEMVRSIGDDETQQSERRRDLLEQKKQELFGDDLGKTTEIGDSELFRKKLTGTNKANKETAQKKVQASVYSKNELNEADINWQATQTILQQSGETLPDYINLADINPNNPALAAYATRLSLYPQEVRDNPDVILRETTRLYYSTEWSDLDTAAYNNTKATINNALERVRQNRTELASISEQQYYQMIDSRFRIYKTTRMNPIEDPGVNPPLRGRRINKDDPHYGEWLSERTPYLQQLALEDRLLAAQRQLDSASATSPEDQRKILTNLENDLDRGIQNIGAKIYEEQYQTEHHIPSKYNKQEAQEYIDKARTRARELSDQIKEERQQEYDAKKQAEEVAREQKNQQKQEEREKAAQMRRAGMSREEAVKILGEIEDPELQQVALETLSAIEKGEYSVEQFEELRKKLLDADLSKRIHDRIEQRLMAQGKTGDELHEAVNEAFLKEHNRLMKINMALVTSVEGPTHGDFWSATKNQHFLEYLRALPNFDWNNMDSPETIASMRKLDEIFFEILQKADRDPAGDFRSAFNMFDDQDLARFYTFVETGFQRMGMPEERIQEIINEYGSLRNLKEVMHNVIYIAGPGDFDTLAKFAVGFVAKDTTFMFRRLRGIGEAYRLQNEAMDRLRADNFGHAPAELVEPGDRGRFARAGFREKSKKALKRLIESQSEEQIAGMEEWELKIADEFAYGYSIINLRHPELIAMSPPAPDYSSLAMEGVSRVMDPIKHLIYKFNTKKPGIAALYYIFTGDSETAKKILKHGWDADQVMEAYYLARENPAFSERTITMENLLEFSTRFGPDSLWGGRRAMEEWSREKYEQRGFGLKLGDLKSRIMERVKRQMIAEREANQPFKNDTEKNFWWNKQLQTNHDIQHRIAHDMTREARQTISDATEKVPLVIAHRWVDDPLWNGKRFQILGSDGLVGVDILKDETGHWITINGQPVDSLNKLSSLRTRTKSPGLEEDHLKREDLSKLDVAWENLMGKIDEIEGDLSCAQQSAVKRGAARIEDVDFGNISQERRDRAKLYAQKIKEAVNEVYDTRPVGENSNPQSPNRTYLEKFTQDVVSGKVRRLVTMVDTPIEDMDHEKMGGRGYYRRIADGQMEMKAAFGLMKYLEMIVGKPDRHKMLSILKEEVYDNLEAYDDRVAQRVCGRFVAGTVGFYAEDPWAAYTGPFGDLIGLFRPTSLAKAVIDPYSDAWGPNTRHDFIHDANQMNILARTSDPFGWTAGTDYMGHDFTAHAIEARTGSSVIHVILEGTTYAVPVAYFLMGTTALQEETGEGGSKGHKSH